MKKLRVVAYAINGRGMGHLVRQLSILRWVKRITELLDVRCECWVLTSSEADTLARREGVPALKMPSKAMMRDAGVDPSRYLSIARSWVLNAIAGLQPNLLMVDTFPGGSFGELVATLEMAPRRVLVARRVREQFAAEEAYQALLPLYHQLISPDDSAPDGSGPIMIREREELLSRDDARRALGIQGDTRAVYVTLGGGGDLAAPVALPSLVTPLVARGWHVVVGAGPLYEGPELRGPMVTWIDRYVPMELFPGVDAAVSAGGYNSFHELMYAGVPTVFLPQPRIADDQHERVERAERAGAGRVARRIEDVPELLENPGSAAACLALVPRNGARDAAMAALTGMLSNEELALARDVLTPELLGLLGGLHRGAGPSQAGATQRRGQTRKSLELLRLLAGGTPSEVNSRRALLAELRARGVSVVGDDDSAATPGSAAERVARFVDIVRVTGIPLEIGMSLLKNLRRKFPAAGGGDVLVAIESLLRCWKPFDDWMGAVSLMRAVPTQRGLTLASFVSSIERWLAGHDDLFDALREFSRLEAGGERTVAETLRILGDAVESAGRAGTGGTDGDVERAARQEVE